MGQGTESCGGYDVDHCDYEDGLATGVWTQRNGAGIKVTSMSLQHLKNAKRIAQVKAQCATFTDEADMWNEWVDLFDREIYSRPQVATKTTAPKIIKPVRGTKVDMICHCGVRYQARQADLNRKQGLSCSKRCAAIRREFGRPAAKPVAK